MLKTNTLSCVLSADQHHSPCSISETVVKHISTSHYITESPAVEKPLPSLLVPRHINQQAAHHCTAGGGQTVGQPQPLIITFKIHPASGKKQTYKKKNIWSVIANSGAIVEWANAKNEFEKRCISPPISVSDREFGFLYLFSCSALNEAWSPCSFESSHTSLTWPAQGYLLESSSAGTRPQTDTGVLENICSYNHI